MEGLPPQGGSHEDGPALEAEPGVVAVGDPVVAAVEVVAGAVAVGAGAGADPAPEHADRVARIGAPVAVVLVSPAVAANAVASRQGDEARHVDSSS